MDEGFLKIMNKFLINKEKLLIIFDELKKVAAIFFICLFLSTFAFGVHSCSQRVSWNLYYKFKVKEIIDQKIEEAIREIEEIKKEDKVDLVKKFRF